MPSPPDPPISTVHALRSRWKPTKQRLLAEQDGHPTVVRLHRAFSWLDRAHADDDDVRLVCLWIAFNALYSRWDSDAREPQPDRRSWSEFLARLTALDADNCLAAALETHRPAVMELLGDEYLSTWFWQEPGTVRAKQSRKAMYEAQTWYFERRWLMLLTRAFERIYLMRCQLVHGASTHGGQLNRASLQRCTALLAPLLEAGLVVLIDHGSNEDWGTMCYPPFS
jgi:hypothetical protein